MARRRPSPGFTLTEIIVIIGIISFLAAMLLPVLGNARKIAKRTQCSSQFHQLGLALIMYSNDNIRAGEVYPHYLTDLFLPAGKIGQNYVPDARIFVCPMDNTRATNMVINSQIVPTLKPIYNATTPFDNKSSWAERISSGNNANCSYLYEFSGRTCELYDPNGDWLDTDGVNSCTFAGSSMLDNSYLVAWDPDLPGMADETVGSDMNRGGKINSKGQGVVTWQDAKFWQLNNGDSYISGYNQPGDCGIPANWSWDPFWSTDSPQQNYARTWIPVVRCFWHCTPSLIDSADTGNRGPEEVLNLALDNAVFLSVPGWEQTAWKYGHSNSGQ